MGSDWPVSTPDPLQAMHVAVNRAAHGEHGEAFLPAQAIDLATAYAAYTSGSAWINRRDEIDGAGELVPGAAADLVVLDRDPFAIEAAELSEVQVVATMVGGRWVHNAPPWD
jgi:predicted amidohydrolase YtcJ